ncbi:rRNA-processing protein BFR2 Ecym_3193 [Eremothecium cymbalariae DBVPG|uniref:Protein BFR2 n=1 Tax=Eremothecium cymbalariae (strain CBS 270.75 / DBVPG 7215 / KCTC 17166 / NRRL Y-17582) TaxID=931890 RepID=G8JRC3_ERECY|nr:Hypothetical protein Ecym_3193 [Eremothecium cymbalariae DBVPG\
MPKPFSEKILEISNKSKARDYDIEDEEAIFEHEEDFSNESSSDENDELKKKHYVDTDGSRLRKDNGIELEDEKYEGIKGSRGSLFNDEDEDEGVESGTGDEEESGEEHVDESDAFSLRTDSEKSEAELSDSDSGGEVLSDEDVEARREMLTKLVEKEARKATDKFSESIQRDALKGYTILQQAKFFDHIIDARIKLQKALSASNQLPLTKETWDTLLDDENRQLLASNLKLLHKVMDQCRELRADFQNKEHINKTEINYTGNNKRSFQELIEGSEQLDASLRDYRGAVLNKWSVKVSVASGQMALSSSKFKAINQPADVQVENQLADMQRLLKRTRLNRRNLKPIGFEKDYEYGRLTLLKLNEEGRDADNNDELDIPKNYDPRKKDSDLIDVSENPYIFDDEDFYRVLLNDLVDKKIATAQQGNNGVQIAITSRAQNKLKNNVDTKASKGRKLNYTIQEAIKNYEAPLNGGFKWSDEQIDELFAGLLGQRVNFSERDTSEVEDDDGDVNAIKNDNIQIFS